MRSSILLAVIAALVGSVPASAYGQLHPFPSYAYIEEETLLYDLDGSVGLTVVGPQFGGNAALYRVGESEPFYTNTSLSFIRGYPLPDGMDLGTPYYVRRQHPSFGCISTTNFVGLEVGFGSRPDPPGIVIPYRSTNAPPMYPEEILQVDRDRVVAFLGTAQRMLVDYLTTQTVTLHISMPYIADQKSSPSLAAVANSLVDSSYTASATVEAPGHPTYSVSNNVPFTRSVGMLVFGEGLEEFFEEHWRADLNFVHWVSTEIPETMLVTAGLEGYTSDTITIDVTPGADYYWRPLYIPSEGSGAPYPSIAFPDSGILQRGVADQLLGDCAPSATLGVAVDLNRDGVHDAADFLIRETEGAERTTD